MYVQHVIHHTVSLVFVTVLYTMVEVACRTSCDHECHMICALPLEYGEISLALGRFKEESLPSTLPDPGYVDHGSGRIPVGSSEISIQDRSVDSAQEDSSE